MNPVHKSFFVMLFVSSLPPPIPAGRVVIEGKEYPVGHVPKARRISAKKEPVITKTTVQKRAPTMRASATPRKKDES